MRFPALETLRQETIMWGFGKPKNAIQLVAEGHAFLQSGQAEKAAAKFQQATELDPQHAEAWFCLGTIHSATGKLESAIECYRSSAQHAPAERRFLPLFNMGNALQELGRLDAALGIFTLTTQVAPDFADGWINRGRLLDDSGHHAEAIDCYDKALALTPDDVMALSNRGNSLRALGRLADARASYEAALRLDSRDPAALNGLGHCLAVLGQPAEGLKLIDKALEIALFPPAMAERGIVLSLLDRHEEALVATDKAISLGINEPAVFNNRGEILARLKCTDEAIQSFDEALRRNPAYVPAHFGKARVLCNTEQFRPALAAIKLYFEHSDGTDDLRPGAEALVALCRDAGVE
jgi:tetratricopeptide (TPR) repeat protein